MYMNNLFPYSGRNGEHWEPQQNNMPAKRLLLVPVFDQRGLCAQNRITQKRLAIDV